MSFQTEISAVIERLDGIYSLYGNELAPAPESYLQELEASIGARIPADYREFLLQFGAIAFMESSIAVPHRHVFPDQNFQNFEWFFGWSPPNQDINNMFSLSWALKVFGNDLPMPALPMANDGMGDLYCIGIGDVNYGKIYFWVRSDPYSAPVFLIADSFTEFLSTLQPDPDA